MLDVTSASNITELIKLGKDQDISHKKLFFKSKIKSFDRFIIVNNQSIINKYIDFLKKIIVEYEMTDDEFDKYKYQPKRFCLDIYGSMELWSLLLSINNMSTLLEFNRPKIKAFTQDIFDVLNEILILEDEYIKDNDSRINN